MDRSSRYAAAAEALRGAKSIADDGARMGVFVDALWDALVGADVSWLGFYVEDPGAPEDARLALGPRREKPACSPIGLHGVCGQAFVSGRTRIVRDVKTLGGSYVACDPKDQSEIVVPISDESGRIFAVLDLDSFSVGAFDESDAQGLATVLRAAGFCVCDEALEIQTEVEPRG